MQSYAVQDAKEMPRAQRRAVARPLAWHFAQHDWDCAMVDALHVGGYTQTVIAAFTGLLVSRISRFFNTEEAKGKT